MARKTNTQTKEMMNRWRRKKDRSLEEDSQGWGGTHTLNETQQDVREKSHKNEESENNRTVRSQEGVLQQAGSAVCMAPL